MKSEDLKWLVSLELEICEDPRMLDYILRLLKKVNQMAATVKKVS